MIDEKSYERITSELRERIRADRQILDRLREDVRTYLKDVRRIQPRSVTAISLVGTDGGNNRVQFDPFLAQVVRVVDSANNEYCLDIVTPSSDRRAVGDRHLKERTPLGRMMEWLGVETLWDLSSMIPRPEKEPKPSWVQVYRELTEWAVLLCLVREKDFGTDTVVVCDGFLRSKVFARHKERDLFPVYRERLEEGIRNQRDKNRRQLYVVGVAKHSKVLQQYRLAMAIEGILRTDYPAYVEIDRRLEEKVYKWSEYARGDEREGEGGEINKFVAGKMFFVKFGSKPRDPIWPVDLLISQVGDHSKIMGYLLADSIEGFPVPFYPLCLQRAHDNASLVDFDMDILQDGIVGSIREVLGVKGDIIDELLLLDEDPSQRRYMGRG